MAYTTINKSTDYFNTVQYTGNASGQTISGVGHQPDFIWVKGKDAGYDHSLHNSVSGLLKQLISNSTSAEITNTDTITSNNADGFVLGADTAGPNANSNNQDTKNYVAWNWKANGQGSANTDGSLNTTYTSVNTTAGFSISKYTGTGSSTNYGHGLGVAPKIIMTKNLTSGSAAWRVSTTAIDGSYDFMHLNTTDAKSDDSVTAPTSSLIYLDNSTQTNTSSQNYISYAFAEKTGYSKIGSYIGNGNNDGTFVYCGFKPKWVIIKKTNGDGWQMFDDKRDPHNAAYHRIEADSNAADYTSLAEWIDLNSNGFKVRYSGGGVGTSGIKYLFMAFGQSIVGSNNIPATAR